ncbi:insulin-like 5a [Brienomyrus brachyistius]|uniref:insulin-like 5a n=1 Tax=Brienomyrus brachyistius TaxID=42636 RepID=UPI0020B1CDC7|nr:insulin-like 5a [Brienomyrus brachyistius]
MSAERPPAAMKEALVSLLLLVTLCSAVLVQGEVSVVKLCGREFFRAIIYTCGASRWRRLLLQESQDVGGSEQKSLQALFDGHRRGPTRRSLEKVITDMCCQLGCRKSDLAMFC